MAAHTSPDRLDAPVRQDAARGRASPATIAECGRGRDLRQRVRTLPGHQECARAALIFVYGLVLIRIRRTADFRQVVGARHRRSIIRVELSRALTGSAQLWGTLAATTLLVALHWVLALLVASSPGFSRVVEGGPVELARHGAPKPFVRRATRSARRTRRGAAPGWGGRYCRRKDCHAGAERQDYRGEHDAPRASRIDRSHRRATEDDRHNHHFAGPTTGTFISATARCCARFCRGQRGSSRARS